MSKQREALELALDALIEVTGWQWVGPMRVMDEVEDAIAAIREALAEPSRKPLTDEEIQEMRYSLDFPCGKHPFINIVKAVERAHGVGGGE